MALPTEPWRGLPPTGRHLEFPLCAIFTFDANDRMRTEGTRNLLYAAGGAKVLSQSIAWRPSGKRQEAVDEHERMVLDRGGVVIRYGQLYGPGTYYENEPPDPPRVHIDEAARRTIDFLDAEPGIVTVLE